MLNAAGRTADGRPLLMLGLSGENMTRLMAGEPILIDAENLGMEPLQVLVCGGRTERDLLDRLRSHGLMAPCCAHHNHNCAPPSELCCTECVEAVHPDHPLGVRCVLDAPPRR